MNFETTMEKLNHNLLNKNGEEFFQSFKDLHKIAEKTFPEDYFNFLKQIGLAKEIQILKNNSAEMMKLTSSYEIDMQRKVIKVKKGNAILEEPLCDLSSMIKNKKDILPNSWQWHLVGSFFSEPNNFALVQTAKAIIMRERV